MFYHLPITFPQLDKVEENDKRFYVLPDGTRLVSVTTMLAAKPNPDIEQWKERVGAKEANIVSKRATGRGKGVHSLCENYLKNDPDYRKGAMPDALESFYSIRPLVDRINNIHCQEQSLWSKTLGLAGSVDTLAEYDNILSVIDFKTSKRIKSLEDIASYFIQTTCYSIMYQEMTGTKVPQLVIIMSVDHEKPQVFVQKTIDWVSETAKAIQYYRNKNDFPPN